MVLPAAVMTSHSSSAFTSSWSTASTMGITMAVLEVLESHMESTVVQHIKQRSNLECSVGKHGESEAAEKGGKICKPSNSERKDGYEKCPKPR